MDFTSWGGQNGSRLEVMPQSKFSGVSSCSDAAVSQGSMCGTPTADDIMIGKAKKSTTCTNVVLYNIGSIIQWGACSILLWLYENENVDCVSQWNLNLNDNSSDTRFIIVVDSYLNRKVLFSWLSLATITVIYRYKNLDIWQNIL